MSADVCRCKHARAEHGLTGCEHKMASYGPAHGYVCACLGFRPRIPQGQKYSVRRFLKPTGLEAIRYRSRMGYPGVVGAVRFEQAKADVAALLAELENLQRALSGFLAQVPKLAIETPAPANDGGQGGTNGTHSEAEDGTGPTDRPVPGPRRQHHR